MFPDVAVLLRRKAARHDWRVRSLDVVRVGCREMIPAGSIPVWTRSKAWLVGGLNLRHVFQDEIAAPVTVGSSGVIVRLGPPVVAMATASSPKP